MTHVGIFSFLCGKKVFFTWFDLVQFFFVDFGLDNFQAILLKILS